MNTTTLISFAPEHFPAVTNQKCAVKEAHCPNVTRGGWKWPRKSKKNNDRGYKIAQISNTLLGISMIQPISQET